MIGELQRMRILAHADHETIEGGRFSLSEDELQEMRAMPLSRMAAAQQAVACQAAMRYTAPRWLTT